jgi:hypothetical protein
MARKTIRISAAVVLLLAGSAAGAPDLQESHRACLQASSGGHTWYYDLRSDVSGTTLDRWKINDGAIYVDRNSYAAFHLPEGGRSTWDEGVAFAATMQTRNAWLNSEPTNTATWVYDGSAGEDTMTWKTTVSGRPQDFVFRTGQCLDLPVPTAAPIPEPPSTSNPATDAPSEGQQPDTVAPSAILHACLEASSAGHTFFYEIHSDRANDANGTVFDRYMVADGVDTFVDSNAFAALRLPDGNLSWHQGIQFTEAMISRGVWINKEATTSASIEHDDASGEDTLTFRTTVNGAAQDYVFTSSQCRGDVPSEPQVPDTNEPCARCGHKPETEKPCPETDAPTEPQVPDTEEPCMETEAPTEMPCPETDVPTEPQVPDTEAPCPETDSPTEMPCPETDAPTEPQVPDTEMPCAETDAPSEGQQPDTVAPSSILHVCLEASSAGHTFFYEIHSDRANDANGTIFDRYMVADGVDTFVDSNAFAALRLPDGNLSWHQGIQFTEAMISRGVWINKEATTSASIEHDDASGDDALTFRTTVNGAAQDYVFRSSQCRAAATDIPSEGQQPDTVAPSAILHACLEASSAGHTFFYEIHSDRANDAAGTTFDRYIVADGVDAFVDSNAFAALRLPDGNLSWHQGIQFTEAMISRGVWINKEATTSASIEHDDASGEDTLTFRTTVNGAAQDYVFTSSQCRGDVPSEPQVPDTNEPCARCGHKPETEKPCPETDAPTEPQVPDTEEPCMETEAPTEMPCPETDVPTEPQVPDTEAPCPETDSPTEMPCPETDAPTEPQVPDTEMPCAETDAPSEGQQPDTVAPSAILHACLEASSAGHTFFYEILSNSSNDAAGTTLDRYVVVDGVDTFVDSNAFAALPRPDGDLPWNQGIQFADAMQSRDVWINTEATTSASIEHDDAAGEDTLTFKTTIDGGAQDLIFRTSQCRQA